MQKGEEQISGLSIKYTFNDGAVTAVKYDVPFDFFLG